MKAWIVRTLVRVAAAALTGCFGWIVGAAGARHADWRWHYNMSSLYRADDYVADAAKKANRTPRDWPDVLAILDVNAANAVFVGQDQWRQPINLRPLAQEWSLTSLGRDGLPGGIGLDADMEVRHIAGKTVFVERGEPPTWGQLLATPFGKESLNSHAGMAHAAIAGLGVGFACGPATWNALRKPTRFWKKLLAVAAATLALGYAVAGYAFVIACLAGAFP